MGSATKIILENVFTTMKAHPVFHKHLVRFALITRLRSCNLGRINLLLLITSQLSNSIYEF